MADEPIGKERPVGKEERIGNIADDQLSDPQRQAKAAFKAARGIDVHGPFTVALHSPEVMLGCAQLGRYLRYDSVLPPHLSELAIMIVARQWTQNFEWTHHYSHALKAGIGAAMLEQLRRHERPDGMSIEQAIVYDFSIELQRTKGVSDDTYRRALEAFGKPGVVDLTGINGYYAMLAMMMNVARTPTDETPLE